MHGFPPASCLRYLFDVPDEEIGRRLAEMPERICFVGHTHRVELIGGDGRRLTRRPLTAAPVGLDADLRYIVNVGSVGQPRDGTPLAKYVIWEPDLGRVVLCRVPYPYRVAAAKILQAGLPEVHAWRLLPPDTHPR